MTGDIRIRVPGNLDLPTRFFGMVTTRQLLRGAVLPSAAFLIVYPPHTVVDVVSLIAASGLGVVFAVATVGNRSVPGYLYAFARWHLGISLNLRRSPAETETEIKAVADDYLELCDGTVAGIIQVHPVNLGLQTRQEQAAHHRVYQEVLETATYPVTIHSRQQRLDLATYVESVAPQSTESIIPRRLRDAYHTYLRHLDRGDLVTTSHYVVVHVPPGMTDLATNTLSRFTNHLKQQFTGGDELSDEAGATSVPTREQIAELDRRLNSLTAALTHGELTVDRVSDAPLQRWVDATPGPARNPLPTWTHTPDEGDDEAVSAEWRQTIIVNEFPSDTQLAWPVDVLQVDGLVDITQRVNPVPSNKVVQTLRRAVEHLEAEIGSQQAAGHRGTNRYEARLSDAEWMLNLLAERDSTGVEYSCFITPHDTDHRNAEGTLTAVQTRLTTMQVAHATPIYESKTAAQLANPAVPSLGHDGLLMPTRSAAAGFPFATTEAIDGNGIVYGEDAATGTPILLNRFSWSSHSLARMGMVGSGKSFATKLEVLRTWLWDRGCQIIVVDPKQEYQELVKALDGYTYTLGADSYCLQHRLVGLTVPDRGDSTNVELLRDGVRDIYRNTSQTPRRTVVVIDEARILLNDSQGRDILNQFVLEARDTNTAVTLVTQNASHFTHSREGREMLDNMPAKQFLRHDRVSQSVVEYFRLSDRERQTLLALRTGTNSSTSESLFRVAEHGVDVKLVVRATVPEFRLIEDGDLG